MKVEMSAYGELTITAENSLESYALHRWSQEAYVSLADIKLNEHFHWRGSKLLLNTTQTTSPTPYPTAT